MKKTILTTLIVSAIISITVILIILVINALIEKAKYDKCVQQVSVLAALANTDKTKLITVFCGE